jgi:hypothetical protein
MFRGTEIPTRERVDLLVVQLEESKRFIQRGTLPHLRLALILLDNAVEILMHRRFMAEMERVNAYRMLDAMERKLGRRKPISESQLLSPSRERKIMRYFDEKVRFLSEDRKIIPEAFARVLSHVHEYRNATFHNDLLQPGSIRAATLILFEIASSLLAALPPSYWSLEGSPEGPLKWKEVVDPAVDENALAGIAAKLKEGLPLDARSIRDSLIAHMNGRIEALMENLDFIREALYGHQSMQEVLADLQSPEDHRKLGHDERNAGGVKPDPAITLESIEWWRRRAWALGKLDDTMEVFREFAGLEKEIEPLEKLVLSAAADTDEGIRDMLRE